MKFQFALLVLLASMVHFPNAAAGGLWFEKVVLEGTLLRAGGDGGRHSLPEGVLQQLCEKGVSTVYYLYPSVNFSNRGSHSCSRGTLEYKGSSFSAKHVRPILEDVKEAAENGNGSVLVHCWNGWHASGEVSAYALIQFCGWSGERAARYWAENIADKGNLGRYGSILNRIRSFDPYPELSVSDEVKSRICP